MKRTIREPQKRKLARLDIPTLIERAEVALDEREYDQAILYIRTAVRRAPLRQDLREMLVMAVEERIFDDDPEQAPRPLRSHDRPSLFENETDDYDDTTYIEELELEEEFENELEPSNNPRAVRRRERSDQRRRSPYNRSRRGPASALAIGAAMGLMLVAAAGGAFWVYFGRQSTESGRNDAILNPSDILDRADDQILEEARMLSDHKEFEAAIEKLSYLPESEKKDKALAVTYAKQGSYFSSKRKFNLAAEAYLEALELDVDNHDYLFDLGFVYFRHGNELQNTKFSDRNEKFNLAKQYLELVLALDKADVETLNYLAKVEIRLGNSPKAGEYYRQIIDIKPDSRDAETARDQLESMGFKP